MLSSFFSMCESGHLPRNLTVVLCADLEGGHFCKIQIN